jgi:hypothetical protein
MISRPDDRGMLANMQSTFELPEMAMKELEALAVREGTTPAGLVAAF